MPEELEGLELILSDTYFCNFSVFQSLPDSWAIGQLFPIMPIHRLDEKPTRNAVLADITCDSDGKIDRFVSQREVKRTLELHELKPDEEYYLAAFLVGAYQETLGDLHNLFGDTHVVHIRLHDQGGWWIEEIVKGDTAGKVLGYMQYDVRPAVSAIRARLRASGARRPHDAGRKPGAAAFLRVGTERLHLPGRLDSQGRHGSSHRPSRNHACRSRSQLQKNPRTLSSRIIAVAKSADVVSAAVS